MFPSGTGIGGICQTELSDREIKTLEPIPSRRKSKNSRGDCLVYKALPLWTAERGMWGGDDESGNRKDPKEQWAVEFNLRRAVGKRVCVLQSLGLVVLQCLRWPILL